MLAGFQVMRLDTHDVHDQDQNCLVEIRISNDLDRFGAINGERVPRSGESIRIWKLQVYVWDPRTCLTWQESPAQMLAAKRKAIDSTCSSLRHLQAAARGDALSPRS